MEEVSSLDKCSLCDRTARYQLYCNTCERVSQLFSCTKCFLQKSEEALFEIHRENSECFKSVNLS